MIARSGVTLLQYGGKGLSGENFCRCGAVKAGNRMSTDGGGTRTGRPRKRKRLKRCRYSGPQPDLSQLLCGSRSLAHLTCHSAPDSQSTQRGGALGSQQPIKKISYLLLPLSELAEVITKQIFGLYLINAPISIKLNILTEELKKQVLNKYTNSNINIGHVIHFAPFDKGVTGNTKERIKRNC